MTYLAETEIDSALVPLKAAAWAYRIALGPRAGQTKHRPGHRPGYRYLRPSRAARLNWARLRKRVFNIDVEHRPHGSGHLKIIKAKPF